MSRFIIDIDYLLQVEFFFLLHELGMKVLVRNEQTVNEY